MQSTNRPRIDKLHQEIVAAIPCEKPKYRRDLANLSLGAAMTVYVNWADRFIPPRPRQVVFLDEFWASNAAWNNKLAILELQKKVQSGADLTKHLSNMIDFKGYAPSKYDGNGMLLTSKWRDKDFALNAYNVHHLHLIQRPKRTGELLFADFSPNTCVFVMVGDHNSFDEPILEGKILNARANGGHELKGIMGPISGGYTPEERNELARAGISTVVSVDGKVVIGASLSTAGTSDFTSWHAGRVLRALADLDNCIDDEKWVDQLFDGAKVSRPAQPDWDWTLSFTNLLLVERHSKAAFPIIEGRRGLTTQISG